MMQTYKHGTCLCVFFFGATWFKFTANSKGQGYCCDLLRAPKKNAFGNRMTCNLQYVWRPTPMAEPTTRNIINNLSE